MNRPITPTRRVMNHPAYKARGKVTQGGVTTHWVRLFFMGNPVSKDKTYRLTGATWHEVFKKAALAIVTHRIQENQ